MAENDPTIQQPAPAAAGSPPPPPADGAAPPAAPAARPDWAPEKFWNAEKGELRVEDLAKGHRELEQKLGKGRQEWEAERLAKRPKDPNGYALTPAKNAPRDLVILDKPPGDDFKPEEGKRYFVAKPDDPLMQMARKHAHAAGLDQDGFSALVTDYAEMQFAAQKAQDETIEKHRAATLQALGENGAARVENVSRLVEKLAGADAVKALDIAYLPAPAIEALEKMLEAGSPGAFAPAKSGGGVASMTQADIDTLMQSPDYWKADSHANKTVQAWYQHQAQQAAKNNRAA